MINKEQKYQTVNGGTRNCYKSISLKCIFSRDMQTIL